MPRPRTITDELAGQIKRELLTLTLRQVQDAHPEVAAGVVQAIKYGNAYAELEPRGAVVGPSGVPRERRQGGKAHKPNAASRAFTISPRDPKPAVRLRPEELAGYAAALDRRLQDDVRAEREAREAQKTEALRAPYLVQLSVVVGLEPADEYDDLRALAAEAAARQVLGCRARNRGWVVDSLERVR